MSGDHPTYQNPTIREALCEIHFRLPEGVAWQDLLYGRLFMKVQSRFPELEPVAQPGLELRMGAEGPKLISSQRRMRFKELSGKILLQLSENVFTVNVLPKYPGWAQMKLEIRDAWKPACEVLRPARITRIGLRYINLVEPVSPHECPGDWLVASDHIPKAVLTSLPGFLARVETRSDADKRVIVTLGESAGSGDQKMGGLVFDIDCIVEKEMPMEGDALNEEIEQLHDTAWKIFSASMTPRLDALLRGVPK